MIETVLTLLAACAVASAIYYGNRYHRIADDRKRLRDDLDALRKSVEDRTEIADRWIEATDTYLPLLKAEINPEVVSDLVDQLDEDRSLLEDEGDANE